MLMIHVLVMYVFHSTGYHNAFPPRVEAALSSASLCQTSKRGQSPFTWMVFTFNMLNKAEQQTLPPHHNQCRTLHVCKTVIILLMQHHCFCLHTKTSPTFWKLWKTEQWKSLVQVILSFFPIYHEVYTLLRLSWLQNSSGSSETMKCRLVRIQTERMFCFFLPNESKFIHKLGLCIWSPNWLSSLFTFTTELYSVIASFPLRKYTFKFLFGFIFILYYASLTAHNSQTSLDNN